MKKLSINGEAVLISRPKQSKMGDKFNRAMKLLTMSEDLDEKFKNMCNIKSYTMSRECATAMRLLLKTGIRVGNTESANGLLSKKAVESFGLTTLKHSHIIVKGQKVTLKFTGKKGVKQNITFDDSELAKEINLLKKVNADNSTVFRISDYHLRKFAGTYIGKKFTPKDIRTAVGCAEFSKLSLQYMKKPQPKNKTELKRELNSMLKIVADKLGNTAAICKRAYVCPLLVEYHMQKRMTK